MTFGDSAGRNACWARLTRLFPSIVTACTLVEQVLRDESIPRAGRRDVAFSSTGRGELLPREHETQRRRCGAGSHGRPCQPRMAGLRVDECDLVGDELVDRCPERSNAVDVRGVPPLDPVRSCQSGKNVGASATAWIRPNGFCWSCTNASRDSVNSTDPSAPVVWVVPAKVNFSPRNSGTDCMRRIRFKLPPLARAISQHAKPESERRHDHDDQRACGPAHESTSPDIARRTRGARNRRVR